MSDLIRRAEAIGLAEEAIHDEHISARASLYMLRAELTALPSAKAVEVKAEQLPPKVPTEWINDGMVLVPQHDWIEMQKELEGYVSAEASQNLAKPNKELKGSGYIRREDAIEAVVCHIWHMPNEVYRQFNCENVVREVVEDAIQRLPSAEAVQGWIPCSERLPEAGEICLLTVHEYGWNCKDYTRVIIGEYSDNYEDHILAWMPLPEPYEPKTERRG